MAFGGANMFPPFRAGFPFGALFPGCCPWADLFHPFGVSSPKRFRPLAATGARSGPSAMQEESSLKASGLEATN